MLTKLLGSDVTKLWPLIDKAIETSMDREVLAHKNTKGRILKKILEGRITCWLSQDEGKASGVIMTVIVQDDIIAAKSLLVYMMSTLGRKAKANEFLEGMETLKVYAKSIGCERFISYTKNPKVLRLLEYVNPGANTEYSMVVMDI